MREATPILSHFSGREIAAINGFKPRNAADGHYSMDSMESIAELQKAGIYLNRYNTRDAMDAIQPLISTASVGTPVQFVQAFLPGLVRAVTNAKLMDEIVGVTTIGTFKDEQIVQLFVENTGVATLYADTSNVPMSGFNQNFVWRDVVRYESGFEVEILEEMRGDAMRINVANEKRLSVTDFVLERARNEVGFYGYNSGNNNTYGFLTDPNLPAYVTVATGAVSSSKLWANKTFLEIINDLLLAIQSLRTQTGEQINPKRVPLTLVCSTAVVDYLSKPTDFPGQTALTWLQANYPGIRVISAPELNGANGGANVFYLFADRVEDGSTDGGATFIQMVPVKFMTTGVIKVLKGYKESFANALAGVFCKRPFAVFRASGI
jgi:hypothetical protein